MSGLQSGILVAFTQIVPEHQLQFGVLKMKVKVRLSVVARNTYNR
jgi:hypothetical protein